MAWREPSAAERALSALLTARGLDVSWAKIRRWREFGALPWSPRRGLGRGAGSVSGLTADTAVVAEALALGTVEKKRLEKVVLRVFTVHPRCDEAFMATHVPLAERGVRKALMWYLGQDRSSAVAVIERAVEAAGGDPDQRAEAALSAAHVYYTRRYHRSRRTRRTGGSPHPADPHSRADARGLATFAAAVVLGSDEVGADSVMESLRESFVSEEDELVSAEAFTEMAAIAAQNERVGGSLALPSWGLTADRARRLIEIDYDTICTFRNVLAVLVESALPLRLASRARLQDPALQHIERVRTKNPRLRHYLDCASFISRCPPADAWENFIPLLISICTIPERLEAFQQDVTALDPALDDVHSLGRRALGRLAPASSSAGESPA